MVELRTIFPGSFGEQPFCGVDAEAHLQRASGLIDGSVPGDQTYFFIPFYPFYLAVLRSFLGKSILFPVFIQVLGQVAAVAALYSIGRMLFSSLAGILASLGLATYSYYHFYLTCYDQAVMTAPFLTLAVFFLMKYDARRQVGFVLGAGIAFSMAALSRPTILIVMAAVVIWLFWYRASIRYFLRDLMLLLLPFVIAASPITWHNYQVSGRLIILSDNFGVNLFTGNNPDAYGLDSLAHSQSQPPVLRFLEKVKQVERGETTFPIEVLGYVREQPLDALALTARKSWLWFGEQEEILVEPFFPLTVTRSRTLGVLPLAWQALAITGLLGILLVRGRSRSRILLWWLIYGTFSAASILFFIQFRFRLPFLPFVILSAASLLAAASYWKAERTSYFWGVLLFLLLLSPLVPGLGLMALLFTGFGFWQDLRSNRPGPYRWAALAVVAYLLIVSLWSRAEALASDVSQQIDIYLGPPLAADSVLGQTFLMDCDGLNTIDLTLGTLSDRHDQPVTFYLASGPSAEEILYAETFEGSSVADFQRRHFTFPSIGASAGQPYFFYIISAGSTPDNAITARGYSDSPVDHYPHGKAFAGRLGELQPLQADFAFGAYCNLTAWQKVQTLFESMWPD